MQILFITVLGAKIIELEYIGYEDRIEWMSVTFPAKFNHLEPNEWIVFLIFWMTGAHMKEAKFFLAMGMPK